MYTQAGFTLTHAKIQKHPAHSSGLKRQALDHKLSFFLPAGTPATDSRRNVSLPFSLCSDHALQYQLEKGDNQEFKGKVKGEGTH